MFNISTAWNIDTDKKSAEKAVEEINSLGFDALELAWINESKFKELKKIKFKAGSVHSYVPEPLDLKAGRWRCDVYRLTASDEEERKQAVKWMKSSIDTAEWCGAPAVVVHLGFPEGCPRRSKPLIELYNEGKKATAEYRKEKEELLKEREFYKAKGFTAGLLSLKEINSYAFKKKIKIGLETRMFYEEFPNLEEFQYIFKEFSGGALYYWHDIGHAEIHGRLGFTTPEEYLSNLKKHLIGLHIHDMRGISDHRAPGTGDVDYHKYLPWLKDPALIKVFELHPFNSREEVIAGRQLLEKLCGESDKNYDRLL